MTNKILLPLTLSILLSINVYADSVITLKNGSQIKGEVLGLNNGVYTVKAPIIGDIHANATDVVSITNGEAALPEATQPIAQGQISASTPVNNQLKQQVQSAQAQLISNPQNMMELQQMIQDPDIAQLLSDPELVRLVTANDVHAIAANPKTQALLSNPKMRAFIEKLRGSSNKK